MDGIGSIKKESDLRAFIRRELGNQPELVRQTQGVAASAVTADVARPLRTGTGSVTFIASTLSAVASIPHGLGVAPSSVHLTGIANDLTLWVASLSPTSFGVQARYSSVLTGRFDYFWLAVG